MEPKEKDDGASNVSETFESVQPGALRASHSPAVEDVRILPESPENMEGTVEAEARTSPQERVTAHEESMSHADDVPKSLEDAMSSVQDAAMDNSALQALLPPTREAEAHMQDKLPVAVHAISPVRQCETGLQPQEIPASKIECGPVPSPPPTLSPILKVNPAEAARVITPETAVRYLESENSHVRTDPSIRSSTPRLPNRAVLKEANTPRQSPQIGTSLLRRESLRRKESPSNRRNLRKSRRETLQRRDTLQEREILRGVIAVTDPQQSIDDFENGITETSPPHSEAPSKGDIQQDLEADHCDFKTDGETVANDAESFVPSPKDNISENKDVHRAIEAIEAYESPNRSLISKSPIAVSLTEIQTSHTIDTANETIAEIEVHEATQAVETNKGGINLSNRNTRSGNRFSDDTSMLKEFLNRAQAKKAAKTPGLTALDLPKPQISPRRSPRKALGSHSGNGLSPQKPRDVPNRPGTPPGKPQVDAVDSDDGGEISAEITSCRRSTRTRLPAPVKGIPGAPSFIPVRRTDGTDPVVLQKSQAQELAMVTRANTRRNKGQSKPPLLALQDITAESAETASTTTFKRRAVSSKTVGWAEQLASYQDAKEVEEPEEMRPKVRRMRGPGATNNGIPAPKRTTAVVTTSNGTPAPKRRGKVR